MYYIFMLIKEFIEDIRQQKIRAFLTMFAITWGTLAVILLMAFGEGISFRMKESFLNAGDSIIRIYGGQTTLKYQGLPIGRRVNLVKHDAEILQESIPEVSVAVPSYGTHVRLRYGDQIVSTFMEGVQPEFEFLRRFYPAAGGRFLNSRDIQEKKRVVFLGSIITRELLGNEDPIGKTIEINGLPFKIVGVMPKKMQTSMNNGPDDRRAIIPFSTFEAIFGWRHIRMITAKPRTNDESKRAEFEIRRVMSKKYKFDPKDERALSIWNFVEFQKIQDKVFLGINIFLGVIGTMSLAIAGVGVANIMAVVAKERTHEIGIKRAVGAKKSHILFQFIFESLLIAFTGGLAGILVSVGVVKLIWSIPIQPGPMEFLGRPIISAAVMTVSVSVLAFIGLFAGLFPAKKAANVDPIEALRYE